MIIPAFIFGGAISGLIYSLLTKKSEATITEPVIIGKTNEDQPDSNHRNDNRRNNHGDNRKTARKAKSDLAQPQPVIETEVKDNAHQIPTDHQRSNDRLDGSTIESPADSLPDLGAVTPPPDPENPVEVNPVESVNPDSTDCSSGDCPPESV